MTDTALSTALAAEIAPKPAVSGGRRSLGSAIAAVIREDRIVVATILAFAAICIPLLALHPETSASELLVRFPLTFSINLVMGVTALLIMAMVWLTLNRPDHPVSALRHRLAEGDLGLTIKARFIVYAPLTTLLIDTFTTMKQSITVFIPFAFDEAFIDLDRWLHFGREPWELLQPIVGTPILTHALDWAYYVWFSVFFVTYYWQVFSPVRPVLRLRFLLAFTGSWIVIGTAMATLLSSAGPAFLAGIGIETPAYDGLIAYLDRVGTYARLVQHGLWESYTDLSDFPYKGISAMPSMHVAIVALMACLGWSLGRLQGLAYTLFAIVIFIGSIHLAFHYAVDGYVAAIVVVAIWLAAGAAARRAMRF